MAKIEPLSRKEQLLNYLKDNETGWVSGEMMSQALGISRTAIWKHIRALRQDGYDIVSSTNKGYRLRSAADVLQAEEIRSGLITRVLGRADIHYLPETDSTNTQAKNLAAAGCPEGTLVVAESQTAGRGRRGRTWASPPGTGIYASLVLRPALPLEKAPRITLTAAVAIAEAIQALTNIPARIKWPNDIHIQGKKVCGILTEMSADMDGIDFVVVGFGINVNTPADAFPEDVKSIATSLLLETGEPISRAALVRAILAAFETHYQSLLVDDFASIMAQWKKRDVLVGRRAAVNVMGGRLEGTVKDVDGDGVLILKDKSGKLHRILSGEVVKVEADTGK